MITVRVYGAIAQSLAAAVEAAEAETRPTAAPPSYSTEAPTTRPERPTRPYNFSEGCPDCGGSGEVSRISGVRLGGAPYVVACRCAR